MTTGRQPPQALYVMLFCHRMQLVIGDSPLNLNLQKMNISGTFQMGTPTCPSQSLMNVFIPGGDSAFGIFAMRSASYDVHAAFTVSLPVTGCR